ncbi:hypothetical protein [Rhodomicrobium lacus]|uniref:hypothetical protein n=1 Tax=Rhodomicrobium lacus TaxID=2498452 RepID=UPI000F8F2391|nr:hypothetical protein [Rhodomicrobium lacus]
MPSLQIEPQNSAHSVDDFFLAIRFARPVSESAHLNAVILGRKLAEGHDLPAETSEAGLSITIDPFSGLQPHNAGAPSRIFRRFTPMGSVEEELRIERNLVGYRTGIYDRWSGIVEKLETLVFPLVEIYTNEVPLLDSVILQYVDRFKVKGKREVDWSELFRQDTPWVVSGMLRTRTAWHSHCGRFEEQNSKAGERRLVNVNVDVGEPAETLGGEPTNSLAILTLCSDNFIRRGVAPVLMDNATIASNLRARFDALHVRSKDILKEVIADAYIKRIGLDKAPST